MRTLKIAAFIAATTLLASCATATAMLYDEDRLASAAAARFGVDASQIAITNRVAVANGTYFDVSLRDGRTTRCFHDGNALGFGLMSNGVRCGAEMDSNPLTGR